MSLANVIAARASQAAKSAYVRAVATLSAGQALATAIPVLAAPLLGRLYAPADYGVLASLLALTAIFGGGAATLELHFAVLTERRERNAEALAIGCVFAACGMAALSFVAALFTIQALPRIPGGGAYAPWFLLLPATIIAAGATSAIGALANRRAKYGSMARYRILQAAVTTALSIALGFTGEGAHGLFIGYFVGQAVYLCAHILLFFRIRLWTGWPGWRRVVVLIRRHRRFPLLVVPSELVGQFRLQLPAFALTGLGVVPLLGNYSRARQLISMPLQLLGTSIGEVFRQRAALDVRTQGTCKPIWLRTFWVLTLVGLPVTLFFMAVAPMLFTIVLGPRWTAAGEVARIVAPMLFAGFVCSPLALVFYIVDAQREEFILSLAGTLGVAAAVLGAALIDRSGQSVIWAYSIANVIVYAVYLTRSWFLVNRGAPSR